MSGPRRSISPGTTAATSGFVFLALALATPEPGAHASGPALATAGLSWAALVVFGVAIRAAAARATAGPGPWPHSIASDLALVMVVLVAVFGMLATVLSSAPTFVRGIDEGAGAGVDAAAFALWGRLSEATANVLIETGTIWRGLLLVAVGTAALPARILPPWIAWASIVLGGAAVTASLAFLDTPVAEVATIVGFATMVAFYFWVPVAGVGVAWSTRSPRAPTTSIDTSLVATPPSLAPAGPPPSEGRDR